MNLIIVLIPMILLSLPIHYFGKWLRTKINPRQSVLYFLCWLSIVCIIGFIYFVGCVFLFVKLVPPK